MEDLRPIGGFPSDNDKQYEVYPPGNAVSVVIVLVGVLDFVNLMVTVIVPCKREFVVIQSVSMTRKQFNRGFDSADLDVGLIGNKCLTFLIRILVNQGFDSDGCSFAVVCDLLVGDGNVFSRMKGTWRRSGKGYLTMWFWKCMKTKRQCGQRLRLLAAFFVLLNCEIFLTI